MAIHLDVHDARAEVVGGELVLDHFVEADPEVVGYVTAAAGIEGAVHDCLKMGARVLRVAGATLDGDLVQRQFDDMTAELDRRIGEFGQRVDQSAGRLLDEETGSLTLALRHWIDDVAASLNETFDENSKKSAIAKLEKVLVAARDEQVRAVRRLLDADSEESLLNRWRAEIVGAVREQGKSIEGSLGELRTQLAVEKARAEGMEKTTLKGRTYEEMVVRFVEDVVAPHEDAPEAVGDKCGTDGSKVGDIVVAISPAATPGRTVRYVIEVKDRRLAIKSALDEIDRAMACRDADAGLMVFASQALAPIRGPFQWYGRRAIVVVDKESPDVSALRLACLWARWTATRDPATASDAVDARHLGALIEDARRSLGTATAIRSQHSKAKSAIDQAGEQLSTLVDEVTGYLDELEAGLDRAGA